LVMATSSPALAAMSASSFPTRIGAMHISAHTECTYEKKSDNVTYGFVSDTGFVPGRSRL